MSKPRQPLICAVGVGVDSTAYLVGLHESGIRPDALLFADTRSEKKETYSYIPVLQKWLAKVGFPPLITVEYRVKNFKHWPPYRGLGENCLTNGTLPSLAFGFKSCSLKWKVQPQNAWTDKWQPAIDCWASGQKVRKIIGYDAGSKDMKRYAVAVDAEDPKYDYWYPLIEWRMTREDCKQMIAGAGLPVPPKSACVFCPATQPAELHYHRQEYLRYIVVMEARAAPRLDGLKEQDQLDVEWRDRVRKWARKLWSPDTAERVVQRVCDNTDLVDSQEAASFQKVERDAPKRRMKNQGCSGLWRSATNNRPAMMTDYIRSEGLLPGDEIDHLIATAPKEILSIQEKYALGDDVTNWHDFLEQFTPEDALDELPGACAGCNAIDLSK